MAANNMSIIHISPNVPSTLMPLQQENVRKLKQQILHGISRGSHLQVLLREAALKSQAEFTGKHPCWSLFLVKLQARGACNFINKRLQSKYFPVKFAKFLRTSLLKSICERLLLHLKYYTSSSKRHCRRFSKTATGEEEIQFETEEFFFLESFKSRLTLHLALLFSRCFFIGCKIIPFPNLLFSLMRHVLHL